MNAETTVTDEAQEPVVPMTKFEIASGIICWLTTVAGAFYALIMMLGSALNPAGQRPSLSFSVFILPLATILLASFSLRSALTRGKVDALGWMFVSPLCVSASTVILFLFLWFR